MGNYVRNNPAAKRAPAMLFEDFEHFSNGKNIELLALLKTYGRGIPDLEPMIEEFLRDRESTLKPKVFRAYMRQFFHGELPPDGDLHTQVGLFLVWLKARVTHVPDEPGDSVGEPESSLVEASQELLDVAYDLGREIQGKKLTNFIAGLATLQTLFGEDYEPAEKQEAFGNVGEMLDIKELSPVGGEVVAMMTAVGSELVRIGAIKEAQYKRFQLALVEVAKGKGIGGKNESSPAGIAAKQHLAELQAPKDQQSALG
jgi:hypothetical protein